MSGCIVGWAHSKFGKHEGREIESLIGQVQQKGLIVPMELELAPGRLSTCPGRRRATRGTVTTSPADHQAAPGPRLPPVLFPVPLAPIPEARSAARRRCAGLSG